MARVYLEFVNGKWKEVDKSDFWIDRVLLKRLQNLKKIQADAWDGVFIVDGMERSGKSILGMLCGWFLSDCKITEKNFARGLQDAAQKIAELPDKSVIIMDEGSTIFNSKDTANVAQKKLIKLLDVVGQKNLIFIICLPSFFDLNKTIAVRRSKFLLHVYPDKETYRRGQYACWGERKKAMLYRIGKKNFDSYDYPKPSDEPGQYPNFKPPFYAQYIEQVKKETLNEVLNDAMNHQERGLFQKYKTTIAGRAANLGLTQAQIGKILGFTQQQIFNLVKEYKDDTEYYESLFNKSTKNKLSILNKDKGMDKVVEVGGSVDEEVPI